MIVISSKRTSQVISNIAYIISTTEMIISKMIVKIIKIDLLDMISKLIRMLPRIG